MSGVFTVVLGLQGAVFVVWAIVMFRTLFRLRARAVADTGSSLPGPIATLRTFRAFVTETQYQRDRRILGALTLLLFALIAVVAALASGQSPR